MALADPADLAEVTRLVRAAGTSFYRGMRVLPAHRRHAMYAVYAFCRIVDDIADEPGEPEAKRAALQMWRDRVRENFTGGHDAVSRVLASAVKAYRLRPEDFAAVIDGMEMDILPIVAPDLETFDLYCDRVAAAVGRLSVRAFGDASPAADRVAGALGRALQSTNVLRDLREDAGRGRLYLPGPWLAGAGVPPEPLAALAHPDLPVVCVRLAAHARDKFAEAETAMRGCDARAMRPARLMGAGYRAVLDALVARGWTRLDPVRVPRWRKLAILFRHSFA